MAWVQNFLDDFNRADSPTVGNDWSQRNSVASTYGIYSNALRNYLAGISYFGVHRDVTVGNTRAVRVTMSAIPNSLRLFVGRRNATDISNPNNGYGYSFSISPATGTATLYRVNNGSSSTSLGTATVAATAGTVYELQRNKDTGALTLLINGIVKLTATDTTYMTASDTNTYGVGAIIATSSTAGRQDGRIDNFTVYEWQDDTASSVPLHLLQTKFYSPAIVGSL